MAQLSHISRSELASRRKQLRWKRRWRALQALWRVAALLGLTVGAIWLTTLPGWVIRQPDQITIRGNELLTPEVVRSLVPLKYPQSIWEIQPKQISSTLISEGPIAQAVVTRRVFPPSLTIDIQEQRPVAIAHAPTPGLQPTLINQLTANTAIGLLDIKGALIPLDNYTRLRIQPPSLKVVGVWEQYHEQWAALYQALEQSPVKVSEVDWSNPGNLILVTELGVVQLGPFDQRFTKQMRALNQMRQLPKNIERSQIAYFDLKDPDSPLIQLLQPYNASAEASEPEGETDWISDPNEPDPAVDAPTNAQDETF